MLCLKPHSIVSVAERGICPSM